MVRVVLAICIYLVIVFACSIAAGFFVNPPEVFLLPGLRAGYLFMRGSLLACELLPGAVLSGLLVACAVSFGKSAERMSTRFSSAMMTLYRNVVIVGLVCVFVIFCVEEILAPVVRMQQTAAAQKSEFYQEYVSLSKNSMAEENYQLAMIYAEQALAIYPESSEAAELASQIELAYASNPPQADEPRKAQPAGVLGAAAYAAAADAAELLAKARRAEAAEDWLNAHYFAESAARIAQPGSQTEADARRLSAQAWNELSRPRRFENKEAEYVFREKQRGYTALLNSDFLEAYYIWTRLEQLVPSDPDVQYFAGIARAETDNQYFFIEETQNIRMYETLKNICFTLPAPGGAQYAVYIDGMSAIRSAGDMVQYLQNVSITKFYAVGKVEYSFTAPYAKMLAYPVHKLPEEMRTELGLTGEETIVPYLMLESINRETADIVTSARYTAGTDDAAGNYMFMPVSYDDFILASRAYQGADAMTLGELLHFAPQADLFGYAAETYTSTLLNRLFAPMQTLCLLILLAVIAWNYQLCRSYSFRLYYLLAFPLFTAVIFAVQRCIRYVCTLYNLSLIGRLGIEWTFIVAAAVHIVLLAAVSVLFLSRKRLEDRG